MGALPVLLLTVRGRKSGEPRDVALNYIRDGDRYVVFASHAGEERDPPWALNLRAAGEADVLVEGRRLQVRAKELAGEERERLWSRVKALDDGYRVYEERTKRRIPVIALEPMG